MEHQIGIYCIRIRCFVLPKSYCSHGKTLGSGTWLDPCGFLDGQKFVCLDRFRALQNQMTQM